MAHGNRMAASHHQLWWTEQFAYPLPPLMPSEVAAVLMCAGISVYAPLRSNLVESSQRVGVIGVGGLGHLAIQFAHALGCEVTAISSSPDKEEQARNFGADHFINAEDGEAMKRATLSFDLLLNTSHGRGDWNSMGEQPQDQGEADSGRFR